MKEIWKDIEGYEGIYQVSDQGRVKSLRRIVRCGGAPFQVRERILKPHGNSKSGHLSVNLSYEGQQKTNRVHTLLATAFLGPCPKGKEVRHGPNGVSDNSVSNICYGTRSDNQMDRVRDGTSNRKPVIRSDDKIFSGVTIAAAITGTQATCISAVCRGRQKTAAGYTWKYYNEGEL
jgi:hypothetical protein